MNMLDIRANNCLIDLENLPPDSFILGFKNESECEVVIAHNYGILPFEPTHRHFGEYVENLKSYVLKSYSESFEDNTPKVNLDESNTFFELITDSNGKIKYLSR